jgi:hypothetical protein
MSRDQHENLVALAGPRVRSPQRDLGGAVESDHHLPDHQLARADGASEAAALLSQQLQREWRGLIPWSVDRSDPMRRAVRLAGITLAASAISLLFSVWLALALMTVTGIGLLLTLKGKSRRIHALALRLESGIAEGTPLRRLEEDIVELLTLDPAHDAARLLVAQLRLQEDSPLDALIQLAPLRDRHPDEGLVVVLAAVAYAALGAEQDAARMLSALKIDPEHPWNERLRTFEQVCREADSGRARVASEDPEVDL